MIIDTPPAVVAVAPQRAADFLATLGVNVHFGLTGYAPATIIADCAYLGVANVRGLGITATTPKSLRAAYAQVAAAGLRLDWLASGSPWTSAGKAQAFAKADPGAVRSVEGPNEVNNFPIVFDGRTGVAAAILYQRALYATVTHTPALRGVPVLDFTNSPPTRGAADAANGHPYPKNGAQPFATLSATLATLNQVMPGPAWFTEAGYFTLPGLFAWEGVDEATQAKQTLNLVMDAAALGVVATYLYDLIDDGPDPLGTIALNHFGLFTYAGQAKPAATALHDLTTVLADPGATATSFTPTSLGLTITGLPATGAWRVLQKSSGVYDLVLWAEPTIWDPVAHQPIAAAPVAVGVTLAKPVASLRVFDPLLSAAPIFDAGTNSAVTVQLADHPLIIEVTPPAAGG